MMEVFTGRGIWFAMTFTAGITIGMTLLTPVADNIESWAGSFRMSNGGA